MPTEKEIRKLAAIMYSDVKGCSRHKFDMKQLILWGMKWHTR
jgi:hypothetical protein